MNEQRPTKLCPECEAAEAQILSEPRHYAYATIPISDGALLHLYPIIRARPLCEGFDPALITPQGGPPVARKARKGRGTIAGGGHAFTDPRDSPRGGH